MTESAKRKVLRYELWLDAYAAGFQALVELLSRNWEALAPPELEEWEWHDHLRARQLAKPQASAHRPAAA